MESRQKKGIGFLREFREFITFLTTLWGLLAGISVFFPLSSVLLEAIPLGKYGENDGLFNIFSPQLITLVATIVTLFVILSTFGRRNAFKKQGVRNARSQGWISMVASMAALIIYIATHQVYGEHAYSTFGMGSDDPRKLFFEVPLLLSYTAFFSLLTRAFMLLGMIELYRDE